MAVVYNYFEPIPILDPENPKFESRSAKHVQSPKELKREKHRKFKTKKTRLHLLFRLSVFLNKMKIFSRTDVFLIEKKNLIAYFGGYVDFSLRFFKNRSMS